MFHKSNKESFHQSGRFQPFSYKLLIELFPFCLILNENMNVVSCGIKFNEIWRGNKAIYNEPITNYFKLRRPKGISFTWKNVGYNHLTSTLSLISSHHNFSICKYQSRSDQKISLRVTKEWQYCFSCKQADDVIIFISLRFFYTE